MLSGQTELTARPWDEASDGLGELRTHLAEDTMPSKSGKPRWEEPNMCLNINMMSAVVEVVGNVVERSGFRVRQIQVLILAFEPTSFTVWGTSFTPSQLGFLHL